MKIDVLTIFPDMFAGPFSQSILGKAQEKGLISITIRDIRSFSTDRHRTVDDYPFGGGAGMLMKPEPIFEAVDDIQTSANAAEGSPHIVMLCPQGDVFCQSKAEQLAEKEHLVLICGHYEGIDERVRLHLVHEEISIGDYVLTGGELPAMVVVDAVSRLVPGVLGSAQSTQEESFSEDLLDYPQYTRPREYRGLEVPEVLLSGDHEKIRVWRRREAIRRTYIRRPDLISTERMNPEDRRLLDEIIREAQERNSC